MASSLLTSLTAYYAFEGDSSDSLGNYDGTDTDITNGLSYGHIEKGVDFNGTTSKIVTGASFATGASNKSMSFWFDSDSSTDRGWIVAGGTDNDGEAFGVFIQNDDLIFHGNGASYDMTVITGITQDTYTHVVVTYDGTTIKSYINGSAGPTKTATLNTTGTGIWFGERKNSDVDGWFDGQADEIGIWSKELTSSEVTELYNGGSGLTYPFLSQFKPK